MKQKHKISCFFLVIVCLGLLAEPLVAYDPFNDPVLNTGPCPWHWSDYLKKWEQRCVTITKPK